MKKESATSGANRHEPDGGRRGFLAWLGGVTAAGLGGGLGMGITGQPAHAAARLPGNAGLDATAVNTPIGTISTAMAGMGAAVPAVPTHKGGATLLDKLTLEHFVPHLQTRFGFNRPAFDEVQASPNPDDAEAVTAEFRPVDLELVEAKERKSSQMNRVTDAFTLVFKGPADSPLEQNSYEVSHASLGTFPLFIVPIGEDADGRYYQAIFSRLRQV